MSDTKLMAEEAVSFTVTKRGVTTQAEVSTAAVLTLFVCL